MSISWQLDANPAPAILALPPAAVSLDEAHAAIELWEHYKRRTLDPTQRLAVEVMMATQANGLWAASTTGREMSRQNGKGDEVEVPELWGLVQRSERILHTVHDAVLLATETQSRMLSVLEGHADLRRLVARVWRGTGQQMIEMRNGGVIWYRTRTGGGARGVDEVDRIVVDEAQHAEEEHIAAITPTQLASSNPQVNALGSAGISGKSAWWWRMRLRAISAEPGDFGYVGHTAEDIHLDERGALVRSDVNPADIELLRRANPALVTGRVGQAFFDEQLLRLGPALYAREHMGVWDDPPLTSEDSHPVPSAVWDSLLDDKAEIASHHAWALAVSPDRHWASIGLAGRCADGRLFVGWSEHQAGTGWIVDAVAKAWAKRRVPIRIHKSGPEGSFIAKLRERGVEVVEVSSAEVQQATGQFVDAAVAGELCHLGQASLTRALRGAVQRTGPDGASLWSQRQSQVEITPLQAVTVAAGGVPDTSVEAEPMFAFSK